MRRETGAIAPIFRTDTRLPVNAALASNHRWEADADGLIRQIKSSPRGRRMVEEEHARTRRAGMAMDRRPALRTLPGSAGRPQLG
jgi:hypothetical protein